MSLTGRHAVVTGGTRGIGRAIASLLAREGARVSVISRLRHPEERGSRRTVFHAQADVTDEEQVQRAFAACRKTNGPIEILVNNAGIAESAPLTRTDRAMWDRIIATNLTGTFLCTREAIPDMIAAHWGRIVNVASVAGLGGAPYISAYCASKHGVVGLTRALAAELAKSGVMVNAVCPGYTETEMIQRTLANITARTKKTEAEARELLAQANPGGRIATADEVALEVLDLINSEQTGAAIVIPREAEA